MRRQKVRLRDIKPSITDLAPDVAMKIILDIRSRRRIRKAPVKARSKAKPRVNVSKLLAGLTPAQSAALLKLLGG